MNILKAIGDFFSGLMGNTLFIVFLIALIGYAIGGIRIKGVELGTAAVFLVALVFGHFGYEVPAIVQNLGLVLFVTAVGYIAGPRFFRNLRKNAKSYVLLGAIVILIGALTCMAIVLISGIPSALGVGILSGSLTTTPGFAAAKEAVKESADLVTLVSVGHGVAYPFGVIGVVLFVQLIPKLLKVNMEEERAKFTATQEIEVKTFRGKLRSVDPFGMMAFALAVVCGILLGKITIPLPGGTSFALGTSGGPLVAGLIFGHFAHIGPISITVKKSVLETFREYGLMMFLIGAGVEGGAGFVKILQEYGVMLFVYGALMTIFPMIVGYFVAKKVLKLNLFNNLGSLCGGMTSTPALGTLISVTGTDDVASAYAATYPVALVLVVIVSQLLTFL